MQAKEPVVARGAQSAAHSHHPSDEAGVPRFSRPGGFPYYFRRQPAFGAEVC